MMRVNYFGAFEVQSYLSALIPYRHLLQPSCPTDPLFVLYGKINLATDPLPPARPPLLPY